MPTNPFATSNRRQQILVPKELFPRKNTADASILSSSSSSYRRPVKLPLRKHHSFHFQPSQTVAGVLKHEQFQQKHHQMSTKERYKNQGPLVFKPFSEKSAFKPIVPSPKGSHESEDGNNGDSNGRSDFIETSTMPRICGTSLKRHISNVETFSTNQWQSDNEDGNATASTSAVNRRKIHYADLAPLPSSNSMHHRNDRNNNSNSNDDTNIVDGGNSTSTSSNSSSSSSSNAKRPTTSDNVLAKGDQHLLKMKQSNAAPSSATTTTQYATLRFDEISI